MVEPTPEQLQKMKKLETAMLASFVEVCGKLGLRYYLMGGTLLGAVRHQGFIPWDDDIDVAMPRADYEVFMREGQRHLPEHLFLQNICTDAHYCMNFAKIRDCRTTMVEYSVHKHPMNHGVFIDIFPLDYYPEDARSQKAMDLNQRLFKLRLRAEVTIPPQSRSRFPRNLPADCATALAWLRYPSFRKALETREALQREAKPSKLWANYCGAWGKKEIMPMEWYGAGTPLSFEGMTVMGPKHYDKWLTQVYGDYMQLPPVEKRVGHHYAQAIDLETPYTEYNKTI